MSGETLEKIKEWIINTSFYPKSDDYVLTVPVNELEEFLETLVNRG